MYDFDTMTNASKLNRINLAIESKFRYFNNCPYERRKRRAESTVVVDQVDSVLGISAADLWSSVFFIFLMA